MQLGDQIQQLAENIWTTLLGWPIEPGELPDPPPGVECLRASVRISGAWKGAVLLDCPLDLARQAAAQLLGEDPAAVTREQAGDVVGELANILGGNFKALVPAGSRLGLPAVVEAGAGPLEDGADRLLLRAAFRCRGETFHVAVVEQTAAVA
jgi:chemotaxis protein CheX